jgi:quaternary ammonium compound-resistance protein SugE
MLTIPVGTAYAVWVGIGAVLTVLVAIVRGDERLTVARALLLVGLVGSVVGLKVVS